VIVKNDNDNTEIEQLKRTLRNISDTLPTSAVVVLRECLMPISDLNVNGTEVVADVRFFVSICRHFLKRNSSGLRD